MEALATDDASEARAEVALVLGIARAAQRSWPAAAWLLERRFPERWAKVARDDAGGDLAGVLD